MPEIWETIAVIRWQDDESIEELNARASKAISALRRKRTDSNPLRRIRRGGAWSIERRL